MMTTEQLRELYTQAVARERAWCRMPRSLQEEKEDREFLRSIEHQRLHVPAPPAAVQTLIESVERELDESRRSATSRTRRVPGSFAPQPRSIREDGLGVGTAPPNAGVQLTVPSGDWHQEADAPGVFSHRVHGALHTHSGGRWTHLQMGKIRKSGTGQESLTAHLATLGKGTSDVGPAGDASEAQHELLHRALTGGVIQEARPEGVHEKLAKAFGHSGAVLQEDADGTPSDVHAKLAAALRRP